MNRFVDFLLISICVLSLFLEIAVKTKNINKFIFLSNSSQIVTVEINHFYMFSFIAGVGNLRPRTTYNSYVALQALRGKS